MKQFFIDMCLVVLILCVIQITFGEHHVSSVLFDRSIEQFEDNVSTSQQAYVTLQDTSDNQVGIFMEKVSQGCVRAIEYIALVFSNFVSMIMTVVVYY